MDPRLPQNKLDASIKKSYESFGWRSAEKKAVDDGSSVRRTRNQCHRRQCTGRLGLRLKKTHRLDYCHHVASYRSHSMFQGSGVTLRKGAGVGDEWPCQKKRSSFTIRPLLQSGKAVPLTLSRSEMLNPASSVFGAAQTFIHCMIFSFVGQEQTSKLRFCYHISA